MFCSKCGNRLPDDAVFCSKCGAKVLKDSTTSQTSNDNVPPPVPSKRQQEKWYENPAVRILRDFFIFLLITILLYSVILPPELSTIEFIKNPRGLVSVLGGCLGATLASFVMFLPLLFRLSNLNIIPEKCIIDFFFLLMLIYEFGSIAWGNENFSREVIAPVSLGALILGVLVRLFTSSKKKK